MDRDIDIKIQYIYRDGLCICILYIRYAIYLSSIYLFGGRERESKEKIVRNWLPCLWRLRRLMISHLQVKGLRELMVKALLGMQEKTNILDQSGRELILSSSAF